VETRVINQPTSSRVLCQHGITHLDWSVRFGPKDSALRQLEGG
jgi:hypothetical protein